MIFNSSLVLTAVFLVGFAPAMASTDTEAGWCAAGNCLSQPTDDLITTGPYKGWRMIKTKIIGDEDSRRVVGPAEADHASAVGMIYCSGFVDGEEFQTVSTGTVVGNRSTIIASAHGLSIKSKVTGRWKDYDITKDCDFRKYRDGKITFISRFTMGEFGNFYRDKKSGYKDWSVLRLQKPLPHNYKTMAINILKMDKLNFESRIPIEVIAHHHDADDERALYHSAGHMQLVTDKFGYTRLGHSADTNGRASGAAVTYVLKNGTQTIFGIHVGDYYNLDMNLVIPIDSDILNAVKRVMNSNAVSI